MWNHTYPNRLFWETIYRPLRDAAPSKFLHALETYWRTPTEDGVSLTIFFKGGTKIGLTCSKGALITFELGGVAQRNFGTRHAAV